MAKYGKKAQELVEEAMHKYKRGKLKSGKSGKTVKKSKQAVAIGLSEAREKGVKVPSVPKKATSKTKASRTTAAKGRKTKIAKARTAARSTTKTGTRKKTTTKSKK